MAIISRVYTLYIQGEIMSFFNYFANFNIGASPFGFGANFSFNFGCFNSFLPNFNMFNLGCFTPYNTPMVYTPSLFTGVYPPPSFQNVTFNDLQKGSCFNFGSYNVPNFAGFDSFSFSSKPVSDIGKEKIGSKFTYVNDKDIYASHNAAKIKDLTPEMQERTKKLIAYANSHGYDVKITSGYRSQAQQDELRTKYEAKGQTRRAAKVSPHTAGKAIDIRVMKDGKRCEAGYDLLGEYAVSELGMRWGGNFKNWDVEKWHFDYDWKKA